MGAGGQRSPCVTASRDPILRRRRGGCQGRHGVGSAASRTSASSGEGAGKHGRARSAAASLEIERPRETRGRQGALTDAPGGGPGPSGAAARICRTASDPRPSRSRAAARRGAGRPTRRSQTRSPLVLMRVRGVPGRDDLEGRGHRPEDVRQMVRQAELGPAKAAGRRTSKMATSSFSTPTAERTRPAARDGADRPAVERRSAGGQRSDQKDEAREPQRRDRRTPRPSCLEG